jgi:hypothetical protein
VKRPGKDASKRKKQLAEGVSLARLGTQTTNG